MPLCTNYGGTLQNYALQKVLKELGYEPITLRLPTGYQGISKCEYIFKIYPILKIKHIIKRLLGRDSTSPEAYDKWCHRVSGMEQFVSNRIYTTPYLRQISLEAIEKNGIETIIVGSDQIWRPTVLNVMNNYFCGFAKNSNIKRISYAASFALDKWPFDRKMTVEIKHLIKGFSAVSVRERNAVDLCKKYLNIETQWVLDPTMLLSKEDYCEICSKIPLRDKPFVFAYFLDKTSDKICMVENAAKSLGCEVVYLDTTDVKADDTIEKWLANFRDSKYIITDSFHGTVFSLIFNKQFYCFYNSGRGNGRIDSLKLLTGLDDRFIQSSKELSTQCIDYSILSGKVEEMKKRSIQYLNKALN